MSDVQEHGIDDAVYANTPYGLIPLLICLCGFQTCQSSYNWEEAGMEFDEHLRETASTNTDES